MGFVVDTDVSNVSIGGVLSQIEDQQERVIVCYSKTPNKAKGNYCATRCKLLANVRTLEHFHKYLYGQGFHLQSDHSALTSLMSFRNLKGQTTCWIQRLQEYNFTSKLHQGRKHNNADALSRRPCQDECTHCHNVEARADIKQVQAIEAVATTSWDPAPLRTEQLNDQAQFKSSVRNGILERHWESANGCADQTTGGPSGSHLDVNKTLNNVWNRYYWLKVQPVVAPQPEIGVKCISTT
jgi:hypothetical protein